MRIKITVITFFIFVITFSQKTNPVIYGDLGIGYARDLTKNGGILQYGSLNYQNRKNLFTFRYSEINQLGVSFLNMGLLAFPILSNDIKMEEIAILYGRRYIDDNFSYSFSAGLSTNNYVQKFKTEDGNYYKDKSQYIGVPFEFGIKWFKKNKSPYRIYELIPVGKPIGLGNSVGFKLLGNISKHSYVGIGVDFGIGYHKEY
ncbi:hypothetical protein [Epilithonimonas mollis]|uniref:Outer membrane protein beta-barrel domain-containing protein n=1 Tax=Epilithonimonas mollis TaxID=216903 RepID=A0A1M6PEK3_9FLAO|nr:hypothetical protein [Epilithonimonas mollis]SHK06320.1 hypothetical protein SAMN05444371_1043 [Epilithonimonas mollis]